MPPLNMNCVVPREQHSLASPGILGPPRAVLPTELHRAIQCFASSGPNTLRFAETTEGFSAEIQWPTGTPTKPFLAVPPPLLTLIDDLQLPRPFWSINIENDILSCSLSWPNRAAAPTPTNPKTVPTTPPHSTSPANDSGYSSPPPSSPPSPPRSRLTFAEAVTEIPAATPSIPLNLPRSPTSSSTPKAPTSHHPIQKTTTCSSTQTKAENQSKTTQLKSASSQTSCPTTNSNTTQTTTTEPATVDKFNQTSPTKLQCSSSQCTSPTTSSTNTQTDVPLLHPTVPAAVQSRCRKNQKTTTTAVQTVSDTKPSSTQTTNDTTNTPCQTNDRPTCKLCFETDLDPDMPFLHLLQCPGHKSADTLVDRLVKQWTPAASVGTVAMRHIINIASVLANDLIEPPPSHYPLVESCIELLASLFPEEDGFESDLGCLFADVLVDTPMAFADPDDPDVNEIMCQPTVAQNSTNLNATNDSKNDNSINNNTLESNDGANYLDEVAYYDDDWTNFNVYDDHNWSDDGYDELEEY